MKIGIIGTRGIPNQYGGFEQFAQYLSAGLAAKGHEVYVYNSSLHSYKEKMYGNVHLIHCKDWENKIGTAGQFVYDLNCINDSRKRNFDALLHLGYTSDSLWYWRWPQKTTHTMNMDGMEWKRSKYGMLTKRFLKWAESLAVKHADSLIADSTGIQQHLSDNYYKPAVYIPYGATIFAAPDETLLSQFDIQPKSYSLLMARMEPENNIEMVIKGYLSSEERNVLLVIGSTANKYGSSLVKKYTDKRIRFAGSVYDQLLVNNLRYYSTIYFHGHSVGGTNPSLLEAMACGCRIIAHDNIFNKAILKTDAEYFLAEDNIATILNKNVNEAEILEKKDANFEKVRTQFSWQKIIDDYETVLSSAGTMG